MTALDGDLVGVLAEQQAYYVEYAETYDRWIEGYVGPVWDDAVCAMTAVPIEGNVLELGCGTGHFTAALSGMARHVTALDGAQETLAILRERGLRNVDVVRADVFSWTPARTWDLIFMANFLAHVPPGLLGEFFALLDRALVPGGKVVVFDVTPGERFTERGSTERAGVPLVPRDAGGRTYEVVKKFWEPEVLLGELEQLPVSWSGTATLLGEEQGRGFVMYTLTRNEASR